MIARIVLGLIVSIALFFAIGCSKSSTTQASFGSSSDSSSSPFKSSSKSSSGGDEEEGEDEKEGEKETAFQRDVRNYTVEFSRTGGEPDIASFQRSVSAIAEGYGITDWERTRDAFVAVGRGIGESEIDDTRAKQLAVALSNEDYDHLMLIRSGLESRRN